MFKTIDDLLTPNPYSRPGKKIQSIKGIVVHWVQNPRTSARANRNFFENRKAGATGYGSAHYIIDLNGDIIRCIPEDELAYHVGAKEYKKDAISRLGSYPNNCTLGIECTHIDDTGKMTDETYRSLVELTSALVKKYKLTPATDLYRHYDITGKNCHKWFIDNEEQWKIFKEKTADPSNDASPTSAELKLDKIKKTLSQNPAAWKTVQDELLPFIIAFYNSNPGELIKLINRINVPEQYLDAR